MDHDGRMIATFAKMDQTDSMDSGESRRRFKRTDASLAEQLSKNVTKILEDLLKDYDKTERPSFKKGIFNNIKRNWNQLCLLIF